MLRLISILVRRVDDVAFVRCGNTMNRCVGNKCMRRVTITGGVSNWLRRANRVDLQLHVLPLCVGYHRPYSKASIYIAQCSYRFIYNILYDICRIVRRIRILLDIITNQGLSYAQALADFTTDSLPGGGTKIDGSGRLTDGFKGEFGSDVESILCQFCSSLARNILRE